jgi:Tfp pilus assembly protein PilZ
VALGPREKRETDRIQPFVTPCKLIDGERTLSAYLADLSTRGARVSSNASLERGAQSVVIQVRLSRGSAVCKLPARIQWMQAGGKPGEAAVFGVTFEAVPADVQKQLEHVVKEFQRRAALLT